MTSPELKPSEVHYPETDGQPMAESDLHRDLMLDLIAAVKHHVGNTPNIYVSGNLLIYFVEGDPTMSVAPDFFVVRGIPSSRRRVYKVWEEGKGPEIAVELTSPSTHLEDLGRKRAVYESLQVEEYFLFDPEGIRFDPQLRGFRLQGGILQPVAATHVGGTLVMKSSVLGLELHGCGPSLRWVDPKNGVPLPIPAELLQLVEEERKRTAEEIQRGEKEKRRADAEKERAEAEKRRADAERERADAERGRAVKAEAELTRLHEELRRLKGKRL